MKIEPVTNNRPRDCPTYHRHVCALKITFIHYRERKAAIGYCAVRALMKAKYVQAFLFSTINLKMRNITSTKSVFSF
jgi:hypothetical protein